MYIKEKLSQHRNDFTATMACQHCKKEHKLTTGYDDSNYYYNVIPKMFCLYCGKDSAGVLAKPVGYINNGITTSV
jgi:hypothetical protein